MGSFYSSYSIPGNVHGEVRQLLTAWLNAKGFEEVDESQIMELDDTQERGVFLYWNDHWTIVLYCNFAEEQRLHFELKNLEKPLLHLWLHDSSLWGYELTHEEKVVSAFISNARYFGANQEVEGPNDIEAVCRLCRAPGQELSIQKVQGKRRVFQDEVCRDFASLLGASPAASGYSYDREEPGVAETIGFNVQHLRFRSEGWNPMAGFNLHEITASPLTFRHETQPGDAWENLRKNLGEEEAMRLQKKFQLARAVMVLLYPLALIFKGIFRLILWLSGMYRPTTGSLQDTIITDTFQPFRIDGDYLINDRHQCRIKLAEGAVAEKCSPINSRFSTVFNFGIEGVKVTCSSMRPKQVEQMLTNWPANSELVEENRTINNLPAKSLSVSYQSNRQSSFQELHFLQAPRIVYVFSTRSDKKLTDEICRTIRATIDSFEIMTGSI
jgi:hypothetical protein